VTGTRWEYRIEVVQLAGREAGATAALDDLGRDGWEAVGFSPSRASGHGLRVETTEHVVLLKRRRRA
jgi:hypothetical protein